MARISIFVIISLIVTFFYFVGLIKFLTDVGNDKCEMTYMYEYPQFIRVSNDMDKIYPKYGLYAYGEGRLTSRVRNMYFDGIPVLFIPGNAGSHKQVRSLSSVALRKALGANTPFHFDYFTVDLNDEFSGLYGPLLYDQLEYVNGSFYSILKLYKGSHQPESIVIIGHSMGGVIANKLLSKLPKSSMVPILITLASPLKRPPLLLDYHLQNFYNIPSGKGRMTSVINLSGGHRDFLIPTFLVREKNVYHFNVVTSNVPMTWLENNHVQILWCKQLILAVNRALFDSVDRKTNFITRNSTYRNMVFNHHLNHHSGIKIKNHLQYLEVVKFDIKGKWIENLSKQYTVEHLKGVKEVHWYMVKLTSLPGHDVLNVLALNLDIVNWVYTCNANFVKGSSRVCSEAYHLTHLSQIVPSIKYKRRFIQINLRTLFKNTTELTHVVFRTLPTDEPIVFHVDVHSETERDINVDLPKWWSTQKQIIIENTPEKALNMKLLLSGLEHVLQYYDLYVESHKCSRANHHASASLITPWAAEDRHAFFTSTEQKPLDLRLYSSKPHNFSKVPYVNFIFDPSCTYKISIKYSLVGTLGQFARYYTPFLLTNIAVVILLALNYQLSNLKMGNWPIIFTAITQGPRGYYLLTLARLFTQPMKSWPTNSLFKPDIWYIIKDGLDFIIMPFILYICSVGIVWFLSILYCISLFTLESTANKLALKVLTRTFIWSNYFMIFLHKVPVFVAVILLLLSLTTCGSLALCLGTVFYFLKLTQLSQDYVENVAWFVVKKFGWKFLNVFLKKSARKQNKVVIKTKSNKKEESKSLINMQDGSISENKISIKEANENNKSDVEQIPESTSTNILEKHPEDDTMVQEISDEDEPQLESESVQEENPKSPSGYNTIFFHSTIFFLWCLVTILNIPAVLTWAHNFKFYKTLSPDDSFLPGVVLSLCAFPLWQFDFPRANKKGLDALCVIITIVILLCLMFAVVSLYKLNYLLTFVIMIVTLHQLFSPQDVSNDHENDGKDSTDVVKDKYDDIKKKLD